MITGNEDILISAQNSVSLKHALDSKLIILTEAGHGANEQVTCNMMFLVMC